MYKDGRKQFGMLCHEFSWAIDWRCRKKAAETIEYNDKVNKKECKLSWMREKKNYEKTKEGMDSL